MSAMNMDSLGIGSNPEARKKNGELGVYYFLAVSLRGISGFLYILFISLHALVCARPVGGGTV